MEPTAQQPDRTHITIVNQAVDYIVDHLFEKITVEMIADHCCLSRHYFNRLFKSVTGRSIYRFIKRARIEVAASKLIKFPHVSITDIAAEIGYSSSNFAVLFKAHYGVSPSRFRSAPKLPLTPVWQSILERIQLLQEKKPDRLLNQMDKNICYETLDHITVVYKRFKGNYQQLSSVWKAFCRDMEHAFPETQVDFYGISYDDPLIAEPDNCLYDLCAKVSDPACVTAKNIRTIPGGSYLCYRFAGHVRMLATVYNDLLAVWMPHRDHIIGQGICFERYHRESVPAGHVVMDLCIPVI